MPAIPAYNAASPIIQHHNSSLSSCSISAGPCRAHHELAVKERRLLLQGLRHVQPRRGPQGGHLLPDLLTGEQHGLTRRREHARLRQKPADNTEHALLVVWDPRPGHRQQQATPTDIKLGE